MCANKERHKGDYKFCQPLYTKVLAEKHAPEGKPSGGKLLKLTLGLCLAC